MISTPLKMKKESKMMQKFFDLERIDAKKRSGGERTKDFNEIYKIFSPEKASGQSARCIQCGDPYCHNKCPLHNLIPHWLKATANRDLELAFALSNEPSPFPEVWVKYVHTIDYVRVTVP